MAVYTVHEPPRRDRDVAGDPADFVFVRDGFSVWAFLLPPLWMLRHRMWLVFAVYLVFSAGLEILVDTLSRSAWAVSVIGLLISLLIGIEAGTLRRFSLARHHWKNLGLISGSNREEAERRFFDIWIKGAVPQRAIPSAASSGAPASAATAFRASAPDIVGLFPEPGALR